jgi:hypothetical protein
MSPAFGAKPVQWNSWEGREVADVVLVRRGYVSKW